MGENILISLLKGRAGLRTGPEIRVFASKSLYPVQTSGLNLAKQARRAAGKGQFTTDNGQP